MRFEARVGLAAEASEVTDKSDGSKVTRMAKKMEHQATAVVAPMVLMFVEETVAVMVPMVMTLPVVTVAEAAALTSASYL